MSKMLYVPVWVLYSAILAGAGYYVLTSRFLKGALLTAILILLLPSIEEVVVFPILYAVSAAVGIPFLWLAAGFYAVMIFIIVLLWRWL